MEQNETDKKLTPRQSRAIEALLSEPTVRGAARKAGVGVTTLYRWLAEPAFCEALGLARARAFEVGLTTMQSLGELSTETLAEIMRDKTAPPAARVRAALGALASIVRAHELFEMEERVRVIEEQLKVISNECQSQTSAN